MVAWSKSHTEDQQILGPPKKKYQLPEWPDVYDVIGNITAVSLKLCDSIIAH